MSVVVVVDGTETGSWMNTFDVLELNKALCDREGVDVCGVIDKMVLPDRLEQTRTYMQKGMGLTVGTWSGPIIGLYPGSTFFGLSRQQYLI